tara:strand:+ start:226 stop:372 length:147 start_codon:yes stop_codon:yes gene_type:complete
MKKKRNQPYSNFLGTGVSTLKVMWWSLGVLVVVLVGAKVVKTYRKLKK